MPQSIGIKEILGSMAPPKIKLLKLLDLVIGGFLLFFLPSKKRTLPAAGKIQRLLVIRPGGIGDAVMLLPILRTIKTHLPRITIDIVCEHRNANVFKSQPQMCDDIYCRDDLKSFQGVWGKRYDVIVDTEQWHFLSGILAYFLKADVCIGFASRPRRSKLFNGTVKYEIDQYELNNFKNLFKSIFPFVDEVVTIDHSFEVAPDVQAWARTKVLQRRLALFMGASIPIRRLTEEQCRQMIDVALKYHWHVILLGGQDVVETGQAVVNHFDALQVHNYIGKTTLEQTAALIEQSQLFVGPDSGLMHLACAIGTRVVAIFGPGNAKKWAPQGERHSVISEFVECSPCTQFGYTIPTCRGSYHCMKVNWGPLYKILMNVN